MRLPFPRLPSTRFNGRMPVWLAVFVVLAAPVLAQAQGPAQAPVPVDPCVEGETLYRAARFPEARVALEQCLADNGPQVDVLLPLVIMGVQEGRLGAAVRYGEAAVELEPDNPETRYWYGRALLRSRRTVEAKAQWEAGLRSSMDHMGLLEGLARLALAEDRTAEAYQLLSRMQRLGAQESWLSRLLADIAAGKGLWAQSLTHLEEAMTLDGTPAAADLLTASELSIMAGDKQRAVDFCRRAVDLEPGATTYGGLGQAYFAQEAVDSALVYLRLAVEQAPTVSRYRFNLANALEVSGQTEEADLHFRTYLEQMPNDSVGRFNYAIHLDKMGRSAEALQEVDTAIALDPNMLTARVVRVQLLENMARWQEALDELAVLRSREMANDAQLNEWEARLVAGRDLAAGNTNAGKYHLQHLVVGLKEVADQVEQELAAGADFTDLVVRFSTGPAAVKGGVIGWLDPAEMVPVMREAIIPLATNEISPPIESKGLYHFFKRLP